MQLQTVKVHGRDIAYRTGGSGPVVLFIHGMAGSSAMWKDVLPMLEGQVTYVAPDLLGHGGSDKPRSDYSLGAQATLLRDLMIALGHERATVVGTSLGGGIALQFAYQYPERVERMALVCAGGLGAEVMPLLRGLTLPGIEFVLPLLFQPIYRDVIDLSVKALAKIGLQPTPVARETYRSYTSLIDGRTRSAFLSTLRAVVDARGQRISASDRLYLASALPTLIVWGDKDPIIPVEHGHATHEIIPGSQLEIFPGAGHYPHCEDPQRFAEVLLGFIGTTDAADMSKEDWNAALVARTLAS